MSGGGSSLYVALLTFLLALAQDGEKACGHAAHLFVSAAVWFAMFQAPDVRACPLAQDRATALPHRPAALRTGALIEVVRFV